MPQSPSVDAITFDAAGTLFSLTEPVGETYSRKAEKLGIKVPAAKLEKAFRQTFRQAASPYPESARDTGAESGDQTERLWWRGVVRGTFAMAGTGAAIPNAIFDRLFAELFEHFSKGKAWRLNRGTRRVLEALHGRVPLGIISNFDSRLHRITRDLGLEPFFDCVILSASVSAWKPDPAIYRFAADSLSIPAESILHVGDDPVCDWEGAHRAGFQVFEFVPETNPLELLPERFS